MPGQAASVDRTDVSDHPASRSSERNVFDAVTRVASANEIERADSEADDEGIDPSWFDRPPSDETEGTGVRRVRGSEPKPDYYAAREMANGSGETLGDLEEPNTAVKPNPLFTPPPGISRQRIEILRGDSARDTSPSLPPILGKPHETLRFPDGVKVPPATKTAKRELAPETLAWLSEEEDVVESSCEPLDDEAVAVDSEIVAGVASTPSDIPSDPSQPPPLLTGETRIGAPPGPRLPRRSSPVPPPIPAIARQTILSGIPPIPPLDSARKETPEPAPPRLPQDAAPAAGEDAERALFATAFAQTSEDALEIAGEATVPANPALEGAAAPPSMETGAAAELTVSATEPPALPHALTAEAPVGIATELSSPSEPAYQPPLYQPDVSQVPPFAGGATGALGAVASYPMPSAAAMASEPQLLPDPAAEAVRLDVEAPQPEAAPEAAAEAMVHHAPVRNGEIIVVFGCRGGAGATTIASNVAGQLASTGREVCLLDFDLQLGDCLVALDVEADGAATVATLAREAHDLDEAVLKRRMVRHGSGLFVASQAGKLEEIDSNLPALMPQFLGRLRSCFDTIIVDGVRDFSEWSLAALDIADVIALVVAQDVASVRRACRVVEVCNKLGYDESKLHLVLNRHSRRSPIKVPEIERALSMRVHSTIVNDYKSATAAQNDGQLLIANAKRRKIAKDMLKVGSQLAADAARRHHVGGVQ